MNGQPSTERPAFHDPSETPSLWQRLKYYCTPVDGRFEDLRQGAWYLNVFRDFTAGLIVAMVAIPLAMGFAMASGLPPAMGIVGGAVAGLVGALFGGSKYQVYGPTAAFIPVIAAIMAKHGGTKENPSFDFLIWCSILAGIVLIIMGIARLGRLVARVPNSIVVGFTIGIAITIAMSQIEQVFGFHSELPKKLHAKIIGIAQNIGEFNVYALIIAAGTFFVTKYLLKISKFIPAPLIALGLALVASQTIFSSAHMPVVQDKFGAIPSNLIRVTLPSAISLTPSLLFDLLYFVTAIVFVSGIESLLCSRMADRLADNRGTPYNPNKELWGQGWVQILVVMFNGFPHTGALARTATNIKVGAISPLAGVFKFVCKLLLAVYLAAWLNVVPMACIGGILLFVAINMVKPAEVREVWRHNHFHAWLMVYTAVMVAMTDFLVGVLSALVIYGVLYRFLDRPQPAAEVERESPQRGHLHSPIGKPALAKQPQGQST
jgi:sulfate permease, SulP family